MIFFSAHSVSCYTRSNGCNKICFWNWSWYPFFIPSFLFIYLIYNKAINLKLNNLKFILVFFYLFNRTFTIFVPIARIYLISLDGCIYIDLTRIMLLTEKSGNLFKSFIKTLEWCRLGLLSGAQKLVYSVLDNAKHLKLKYHRSTYFSGSCHLYIMSCLLLLLLIYFGGTVLNPVFRVFSVFRVFIQNKKGYIISLYGSPS